MTLELLGSAGVTCQICANLREMASELRQGAGALMLTDRALTDDQLPLSSRRWATSPPGRMCR